MERRRACRSGAARLRRGRRNCRLHVGELRQKISDMLPQHFAGGIFGDAAGSRGRS